MSIPCKKNDKILFRLGKMSHFFPVPEPFCDHKICLKSVCGRGCAPDPAGGVHDAPPDLVVGWGGGGVSPPTPYPLGPFGASILALRRSPVGASICAPTQKKLAGAPPHCFFDKSNTAWNTWERKFWSTEVILYKQMNFPVHFHPKVTLINTDWYFIAHTRTILY